MAASKKTEIDISDKLQHIPICDDPEEYYPYRERVQGFFERCEKYQDKRNPDPWHLVVNWQFYDNDVVMDENGMEKMFFMISGTLFEIEKNDVEPDQIYGTMYDIRDFQTGEYDDLFTEEDLAEIRKDIAVIEEYAAAHPELYHWLLNDGVAAEELARTGFKP